MRTYAKTKALLIVLVVMSCGMTAYEVVKQLLFPSIGIWESHIVTIIFSTVISLICAAVLFDKFKDFYSRLKSNEQALHKSEERFSKSQVYANIGTWEWDIQTGELYWSEQIASLFGHERGTIETTYENFVAAIHPDDRDKVTNAVQASLDDPTHKYEIDHRVTWADGTIRWLHEIGDIVRAADGTPLRMLGVVSDIHDRKLTEEALMESERNLAEAQRIAKLGSWSFSLKTGVGKWSEERYRVFGLVPGEVEPSIESFKKSLHPDDRGRVMSEVKEAADMGKHLDTETRIIRPNGEQAVIHIMGEVGYDRTGTEKVMTGTVMDTTKRKHIEDELRAKEATLQTFLDAISDSVAMVDLEANFVLVNRAMAELYGKGSQDLLGKPMFRLTPTEVGQSRRQTIDEVAKTGLPMHLTDEHDGRWHNSFFTPVFGPDGNVVQVALVAREITQDIAKDVLLCKMRQATEQSDNAVFITDAEGTIEYINPRFTTLTGYTAAEAIGKNPRILKSSETPEEVHADIWNTIQAGKEWRGELNDRHKTGSRFWAYATISPIKDSHGTITHYVATHEDISQRKEVDLAMQAALKQAGIANRAKTDLMANMSHELRTPLNAIIGFSSTMKEEVFGPVGDDKYREYLDDIHHSGQHLLGVINDILDVSAIEAGAVELNEENLAISDVIDSSIRIIRPRAKDGKVTVTSSVCSKKQQIIADERRVKQIFLNLLSNAVKFTQEGGKVTVKSRFSDDGSLAIAVSDTGMGMEKDEVVKALSKFGQVDSGLDRKHEGTGLGLPLTVGLVECHGGTLDIKSEKGRGTQITVTFPKERVIQDVL